MTPAARSGTRRYASLARKAPWVMAVLLFVASTGIATADEPFREPDLVTISAGSFDVNDDMTAGQFGVEFRLNTRLWIFRPQVGLFATTDAAFYAYAGLYTDFYFGKRVVLSPSFSIGGFHEGEGKDLGGALEFRSALELAYRFDNASRLGVQIGHISNASIYDTNPGEEFIILNYSIPTTVFDR